MREFSKLLHRNDDRWFWWIMLAELALLLQRKYSPHTFLKKGPIYPPLKRESGALRSHLDQGEKSLDFLSLKLVQMTHQEVCGTNLMPGSHFINIPWPEVTRVVFARNLG